MRITQWNTVPSILSLKLEYKDSTRNTPRNLVAIPVPPCTSSSLDVSSFSNTLILILVQYFKHDDYYSRNYVTPSKLYRHHDQHARDIDDWKTVALKTVCCYLLVCPFLRLAVVEEHLSHSHDSWCWLSFSVENAQWPVVLCCGWSSCWTRSL